MTKIRCKDCKHLELGLNEKSPRYYQSYRCRLTFKYMDPFLLRHCRKFYPETQRTLRRIDSPGMP